MSAEILMAATGGTFVPPAPPDLIDGLVAHYPLNNDSHGNDWTTNYDGTATNTVTSDVDTKFNGVDSWIDAGNFFTATNFPLGFTFSIWIYWDGVTLATGWANYNSTALTDRNHSAISKSNYYSTGFHFGLNPVSMDFYSQIHNDSYAISSEVRSSTISTNTWYHVVVSCDSSNFNMYVNGSLTQSVSVSSYSYVFNDNQTLCIGARSAEDYQLSTPANDLSTIFSGLNLSNLRIYNRVLQQNEITALYNEGLVPNLPIPTDHLVSHYPLSGSGYDNESAYDATETSMTYAVDSVKGSVGVFNGSTSHLITSVNPEIDDGYSMSSSAWVYLTSNGASYRPVKMGDGSGTGRSLIEIEATNQVRCGYGGNSLVGTATLSAGQWYHIVTTFDNSFDTNIYINGVLDKNQTFASTLGNTNAQIYIGCDKDGIAEHLNGKMSSVRLYNKALSSTEVLELYRTERVQNEIKVDTGLVAYYPLHRDSNDSNYNEYDGTDTDITYDGVSANFNNSTSGILIPSGIINPANDFTVTVWVKTNSLVRAVDNDQKIFHQLNGTGTGRTFHIVENTGVLGSFFGGVSNETSSAININEWTFVTLRWYNTGAFDMGYNTNLESFTTSPESNIAEVRIGSNKTLTSDVFDGYMSNFRVYNRALSIGEINSIYNSEKLTIDILNTEMTNGYEIVGKLENIGAVAPLTLPLDGTYTSGSIIVLASGDTEATGTGLTSPTVRVNSNVGSLLTTQELKDGDGTGLAYVYIGTILDVSTVSGGVDAIYFDGLMVSQETTIIVVHTHNVATYLNSTSAYANDINGTGTLTLSSLTGTNVLMLGCAGSDAGGGYGDIDMINDWETLAYATSNQDGIINSKLEGVMSSGSSTYTVTGTGTTATNELCMALIALDLG